MPDIHYSDGSVVKDAIVVIWDDHHTERCNMRRAFWAADKDATTGSPVIGYCSPGGSHRTAKAVAAEVRRYYPTAEIFSNGRKIS